MLHFAPHEAYTDGTPTSTSNKTTEFGYDGNGNTLFVQATLPGGAVQKTQYIYGATTGAGHDINSNDVPIATQYPDPSTGQPFSSQQVAITDRNGNVHTLTYDILGRLTADAITTLGSNVDGTLRRAEIAYDSAGRPSSPPTTPPARATSSRKFSATSTPSAR